MDPSVIDAVVSGVGVAAGAYGQAVLANLENVAADGTVRLGQRLLTRLRRDEPTRQQLDAAVLDVAEHPGDEDFAVALRAQVRKAIAADPELAADLVALLREGGVLLVASGEGSVAVQHNAGIISTGDNAVNRIGPP